MSDLEQRRRAIADALRAVMAEPLPHHRPIPPTHTEPAPEIPVQTIVPPMEVIGSMSRKASLALFGHA